MKTGSKGSLSRLREALQLKAVWGISLDEGASIIIACSCGQRLRWIENGSRERPLVSTAHPRSDSRLWLEDLARDLI